jgi:hypothetical protein
MTETAAAVLATATVWRGPGPFHLAGGPEPVMDLVRGLDGAGAEADGCNARSLVKEAAVRARPVRYR